MWTDKRVDVLRTDWAQGATARQIAEKLGGFEHLADRGRNAVIGKLHRLGLARSAETNAQRLGRINKRRRAYRAALSATRAKPIAKPVVAPQAPQAPQATPATPATIATPRPLVAEVALVASVLDLEDSHCRWPVGDPLAGFCGAVSVTGRSYCAGHSARAYTKAPLYLPLRGSYRSDQPRHRAFAKPG